MKSQAEVSPFTFVRVVPEGIVVAGARDFSSCRDETTFQVRRFTVNRTADATTASAVFYCSAVYDVRNPPDAGRTNKEESVQR
jgi:hypothetical protein